MRSRSAAVILTLACAGCPALLTDEFKIESPTSSHEGGDTDGAITNDGGGTEENIDSGDDVVDAGGDVDDASRADADAASDAGSCSRPCGIGRTCSAGKCTPQWVPTAAPPANFVGRQQAAVCAIGSRIFIWGGALLANGSERQDGAIYEPATDSWTMITTVNAPAARVGAACAWNGTEVMVFGGGDLAGSQDLNTGGRYNPSSNSWASSSTTGAPSARRHAFSAWSGNRFVVFGGENKSGAAVKDAFRYDPSGDAWDAKATGAPAAASGQAVALAGTDVLVFGGLTGTELNSLDAFSASTNAWSSPPNASPPTVRSGAFATATGTTLIVWGGAAGGAPKNDGKRYDVTAKQWANALASANTPSARRIQAFRAGWAFASTPSTVAIIGGLGASSAFQTNGGLYDLTADAWTAIPSWPSGADHEWGAAGMTTTAELVVWSGLDNGALSAIGERWRAP